jgi:GINS complex protein
VQVQVQALALALALASTTKMSSTSRRRHENGIELASYRSAFLADDSLVTIVPDFDFSNRIPLLSSTVPVGPFRAGIPTTVPLWFALMLQQRSLCSLKVLDWLSTEHLTHVKQHEATQSTLTPTSWDHDTTTDSPTLPFYYAELGQRFVSCKTYTEAAQAPKASRLLLQDIAQIRLDKLRQQFQELTRQQMDNPNLCVAVPGIASAELASLKPLITQALNDQRFLATTSLTASLKETPKAASHSQEPTQASQPSTHSPNQNTLRSRIRRLRDK